MSAARHAAAIRELALSFPTAREDHPWGPEAHVFKVGGGSTMFAIMGDGPPVTVTMKLTREEREVALTLPYVSHAKYVGRYGWVTARVEDADCLERDAGVDPRELLAEGAGRRARGGLGRAA